MTKITNAIKNFKWGYLLFAILLVGAGLAFLSFPDQALNWVRMVVGGVAIVFSGIFTVLVLAERGRGIRYWAKMIIGVIGMVCGGFMCTPFGVGAFPYLLFVFGLYLLIDAAFKLQTAILSKRYKSAMWWVILLFAVAGIALGTILIRWYSDADVINENIAAVSRFLGIGLALDGISNLLSIAYLYQIEHGTRRDIEEQLRAEGVLVTVIEEEKKAKELSADNRKEEKERKKATRKDKFKQDKKSAQLEKESVTVDMADTVREADPIRVGNNEETSEAPTVIQVVEMEAEKQDSDIIEKKIEE